VKENPHLVGTFAEAVAAWLDGAWLVWAGLAAAFIVIIVVTVVSKLRARARRDRVPRYRRGAGA
jgi:hypothetical protein